MAVDSAARVEKSVIIRVHERTERKSDFWFYSLIKILGTHKVSVIDSTEVIIEISSAVFPGKKNA